MNVLGHSGNVGLRQLLRLALPSLKHEPLSIVLVEHAEPEVDAALTPGFVHALVAPILRRGDVVVLGGDRRGMGMYGTLSIQSLRCANWSEALR